MKTIRIAALLCGASMLLAPAIAASVAAGEAGGAWTQRVQVIYLAETKSVVRKTVRVWDPHPEKNLDFVWEPESESGSGIAPDGTIAGKGTLVWRVRGSASYDPRTIYSEYSGDMLDGRPNGHGRLEIRSGESYEGDWRHGVANGRGVSVDVDGNRYEGEFAAGLPHGAGRYLSRSGEIFEGTFVAGLREGKGKTRLAGGTEYESEWRSGKEIGGLRPDVLADATIGGLLKAQSGGGDAGKVEISTIIDERMNQQMQIQYKHLVRDEDVAILPLADALNYAWNGTYLISEMSEPYTWYDFTDSPVFTEVEVATTDGTRVELDKLELQVERSVAYRKPMLSIIGHRGCVGFRPSFNFLNNGWGEVKDASLSFQFSTDVEDGPQSRTFSTQVGSFDSGIDVYVRDALSEAGVDVAALETERFACGSIDDIAACRAEVFDKVNLGEIKDLVWGEDRLMTTLRGNVAYNWSDDGGNSFVATEPFRVDVALARIELPEVIAENGDGFGGNPEAARYQRIDLPTGQNDYAIDLPVKGNNKISKYEARLKFYAEMSSFHSFQPVAKFADGSEKRGKPVSLFYFRPRPAEFLTQADPAPESCYLNPDDF